ncbi:hypothetical protein [Alcanivorax hongdengensis]|uniref:hypothetical protein n=1 Tax=Alcanivorax hongdengensis TaxID=519051 RepID=UPI0012F8DC70|nr:hypothetical protein [Alcanivorax hongdengensis]
MLAGHGTFILWRQDDNGVRVPMRRYQNHQQARQACEYYQRLGHKQHYWVEHDNADSDPSADGAGPPA